MVVRGICISDSMPSCMRAPPEAGTTISAASCSTASRAAASSPSPTATPIEPPMKPKSNAAITAGAPPMRAVRHQQRVAIVAARPALP